MSALGDAIRSNADLHQTIYTILGVLASTHITRQDIGRPQFEALCAASAKCLPHVPAPVGAPQQ